MTVKNTNCIFIRILSPSYFHDSRFQTPGVLPEKLGGVCGQLPKTLTLFMTKICDIPYPIYDLTFKSKPCF